MRRMWLLVLCVLAACDSSRRLGPEYESPLPLDIPSADESIFAECRDFTVVGYFDPPLVHPGDVRVELFSGGRARGAPLRDVRSHVDPASGRTPRGALDFSYAQGQAWGPDGAVTDPDQMVMTPDLVASPGGFLDPTNKVVVTRNYYAAVILGGVTKDFDTRYEDANGNPWADLTAGVYTLRVTGLSGELSGHVATRQIVFGRTDAMLGRFSPPHHKERLLEEATATGRRTYIDFFPGFFSHGEHSYEIIGRWMPNNAVEVVNTCPQSVMDGIDNAFNDVLLYNISASSATNRIEIGSLATYGLIDSDHTTFHYYSLGEPLLRFVDRSSNRAVVLESSINTMEPLDRLVLTRAEVEFDDWSQGEDRYDVRSNRIMHLFKEFETEIRLDQLERLAVFGVVSPIPTATRSGASPVQYELENTVSTLRYEIRDASGEQIVRPAEQEAVGLRRRYDPDRAPGSHANSVYEFEFEIRPAVAGIAPGAYLITLEGLDAQGTPVLGSSERFAIRIAPAGH